MKLAVIVLFSVILFALGVAFVEDLGAAPPRPYSVYKVPHGCLYIVSNQAGIDAVFVADQEGGACHD